MKITSSAFKHNQLIPTRYTCDGENINPPLSFKGVPGSAKSLALIVDDPDAPIGTAGPGWVHWILYNIKPGDGGISENSVPVGALQGRNDWERNEWGGPCPPSGTHRYFFRLFALSQILEAEEGLAKSELMTVIKPHIIGQAELIGLYSRQPH